MATRRTTLAGVTSLLTLSTAGCLSDLGIDSDDSDDTDDEPASNDSDETDDAEDANDSDEPEQVDGAYELTAADLEEGDWTGEWVRLEGTVTEVVGGDVVERFVLEDETGSVRMVYPDEERDDFGEGYEVRVEGLVTDGEDVPSSPPVIEEAVVYVDSSP
ncbi:OB-fold nucleic acid binding domain-containing protein [Natrononativus amylolyticus]|uniref:OB-fold nucleic acid binding domain-containing protein n=1 Tax=Natrononativus amylolyticus TaxID=2963434 RepID=UPI0020CBB13D|nr:OB-fold nucleic acid binding domain-containing protein [Natrononativus amylolyticus]